MMIQSLVPKPVDLAQIESAITEMWKNFAFAEESQTATMRPCVLNLVVYVESARAADEVRETLSHILARHPSRLLLIQRKHDAEGEEIEAFVSALCQPSDQVAPQICCEEITFLVGGNAFEKLHPVLLKSLAAETPVVLWWRSEPDVKSHFFRTLVDLADHVIVNSTFYHKPNEMWRGLSSYLPDLILGDITWLRLAPWCELVAQFFDAPDTNQLLNHIKRVTLDYSVHGAWHNPTQAFLFAAWLASRLGWQDARIQALPQGEYRITFKHAEAPVEVHVRANQVRDERTDRLINLAIQTETASGTTEFAIARDVKQEMIIARMRVNDGTSIERATLLEMRREPELLAMELDRSERDLILQAAWDLVLGFVAEK